MRKRAPKDPVFGTAKNDKSCVDPYGSAAGRFAGTATPFLPDAYTQTFSQAFTQANALAPDALNAAPAR